jgi:hypothetical protein
MMFRAAILAVSLALGAGSARAASVTYDFIEAQGAPHPGTVGAILTFASPPAEPNAGWTGHVADILSFQITDAAVAQVGSYTPFAGSTIASLTGAKLDSGAILAMSGAKAIFGSFSTAPGTSVLVDVSPSNSGATNGVLGDWRLVPAVATPEPSTFALSLVGGLGAVGYLARRRKAKA